MIPQLTGRVSDLQISSEYRPIPFWSWNDKLDPDELVRQIHEMKNAGMGGFFMHARGGLLTEYMSDEWFDNVKAAIDEAHARGMHPWAYDENGWPSGFGGGKVNGKGLKYQQKYLRYKEGEDADQEHLIINKDGYCFYYDVNPFYVDTLDLEVTQDFINEIYEPYYEKFGNRLEGFFTDEPQISRNGIPWSWKFPDEYKNKYGEDILEKLIELMSINPRRRFGIPLNSDFTVWDLEKESVINPDDFLSKGKLSHGSLSLL